MNLLSYLFLFFACYHNLENKNAVSKNNNDIVFIDSVAQYKTINDALKLPYFKNKVVYIDLWATTCIPCIREFAFSNTLHEKYKNKNVEFLYICDNFHGNKNDEWRKKWKDLVNEHNLSGIHLYTYVLPPDSLIHKEIGMDFLAKLSDNGRAAAYGVPYYMLAKNGKVVLKNVTKPSEANTGRLIDSLLSAK